MGLLPTIPFSRLKFTGPDAKTHQKQARQAAAAGSDGAVRTAHGSITFKLPNGSTVQVPDGEYEVDEQAQAA
jgi:hypothetical protein